MTRKNLSIIIVFLAWIGLILAAFFVVQKPVILSMGAGILSILSTLVFLGLFLMDAACLGVWIIKKIHPAFDSAEQILLGTGLGMGCLGILGFLLAISGIAHPLFLILLLTGFLIYAISRKILPQVVDNLVKTWQMFKIAPSNDMRWVPWAGCAFFILSFSLAFAPPADAFDALLYHLSVPLSWLKNSGLVNSAINPPYWFPDLVEGIFSWGLAFKNETFASISHLTFGILTVGLIWRWSYEIRGRDLAWRSTAILISIPSLPLLASWAYTDLALAFYCVAALYSMWRINISTKNPWFLSAIFSGMAMGVKYTSFILPVVLVCWLGWFYRENIKKVFMNCLSFSGTACLIASPWYLRNLIMTGNPFYPFVFGGKLWDGFLASSYANAGTGIHFDIEKIFLLPLNVTLGHYDVTYYDGRIGPWWLILLPIVLWFLWNNRKEKLIRAIYLPIIFGFVLIITWVIGVINSASLWQSRLLFPALFVLAPLTALAWEECKKLDSDRFHLSFIINSLFILYIASCLFDFGFFVLSRNPIAYALNLQSRQAYFERTQPSFADALNFVDQLPTNAKVYFLFEPRSYGMDREVVPDAINENLSHDFYLYNTPENIIQNWQIRGYGYVLYQKAGEALLDKPAETRILFSKLKVIAETQNSILYQVPAPRDRFIP
jgi:hypothetical protein